MPLEGIMSVGLGTSPIVLMFHGYGNDEQEMLRVWKALYPESSTHPDYISFRAPDERPYIGGRYWYPHGCSAYTRQNICTQIGNEVAALVNSPLFTSRPLALMGFSQGGYVAYRLVKDYPHLFDMAVLLSPSFVGEKEDSPLMGDTQFVLCYGTDDDVIPSEDQRRVYDCLLKTGRLTNLRYEGMGHTICDQEIADIRNVLEERW